MDNNDLTPKHVLPVFVILCMFVLMAVRGESGLDGPYFVALSDRYLRSLL